MTEQIFILILIAVLFLTNYFIKRTPKFNFWSALIGIVGFTVILIQVIVERKIDVITVGFYIAMVAFLIHQAIKNYPSLKARHNEK